jgi:hypothetical protein
MLFGVLFHRMNHGFSQDSSLLGEVIDLLPMLHDLKFVEFFCSIQGEKKKKKKKKKKRRCANDYLLLRWPSPEIRHIIHREEHRVARG